KRDLADIDAELLNLKKRELAEKLAETLVELEASVTKKKGAAVQDLINRGLGNTTVKESVLRAIDQDAVRDREKAIREYGRATEEIALLERKLYVQSQTWWRKLLRWLGSLPQWLQPTPGRPRGRKK